MGEKQPESSVKPEQLHSAFFCSIIPCETGASANPSERLPLKAQVSLLLASATSFTETALCRFPSPFKGFAEPLFSLLFGGLEEEAWGALGIYSNECRGQSSSQALTVSVSSVLHAMLSWTKHRVMLSLFPNQSLAPTTVALWVMVFDLTLVPAVRN